MRKEMTVRFDDEERAALQALAKRLGGSEAAAVRKLLRDHMAAVPAPAASPAPNKKPPARKPARKARGKK